MCSSGKKRIDLSAAPRDIHRVKELLNRNIPPLRVTEKAVAVGKGKLFGFDQEVGTLRIGEICKGIAIREEQLFDKDHPLAWRRLPVHNQVAVAPGKRWEDAGFVACEVIVGKPATGCLDNQIRNTPAVEARAAILSDVFQRCG